MTDSLSDNPRRHRSGFTLIELLVVIGIIMILIAILIPAIGRMRLAAKTAATQATMNRIAQSINIYLNDFQAYPGAMSNSYFTSTKPAKPVLSGLGTPTNYTQTEDCAMALLGGWQYAPATQTMTFTKGDLGSGPICYSPLPTAAKRFNAYMEYRPADCSPAGSDGNPSTLKSHNELALDYCVDTEAPEFMDSYADPRPIIYVRANSLAIATEANAVSTDYNQNAAYNFGQVTPYLSTKDFGGSRDTTTDPVKKFFLSSSGLGAKNAGSYMLLDAGPDRIFGTSDDIVVGAGGAQ